MSNFIPLESVSIASPCRAEWSRMQGDDQARFCGTCRKNVYNLSAMSREEAEALIVAKEGSLCVRFYQRADGTIVTDNCPVGLKLVRRPFKWLLAIAAAGLAWGASIAGVRASDNVRPMMGAVCLPVPTPRPTAKPTPKPGKNTKQKSQKRVVHK